MQLFTVDAFAKEPFTGNPAAVCLMDQEKDDAWHQAMACEMNLSETAFVKPAEGGSFLNCDGTYDLRWFTPGYEVDLCGHATLATAHTLWNELGENCPELTFLTRSGPLKARKVETGIELNFPSTPPNAEAPEDGLLESLGLDASSVVYSGKSKFDAIVQLESEDQVLELTPDFLSLGKIDVRGTIVTAKAEEKTCERAGCEVDFVSRFFAPTAGIHEDPVTGSAHCCLTPYWSQALNKKPQLQMVGFQASQRGGVVEVELCDDRVRLTGRGFTVLNATLEL